MLDEADRTAMRWVLNNPWVPGSQAKFVITPAGAVYTWTYEDVDHVIHGQVRRALGVTQGEAAYGYVERDGQVSEFWGPRDHEAKLYEKLGLPVPMLV